MELAQELFVTAVVAVLFSFFIAKLVSLAVSGNEPFDESKAGGRDAPLLVEEVRFSEDKLTSPSVGSDRGVVVEAVPAAVGEELRAVDRFGDVPVADEEEAAVPVDTSVDDGLEKGAAADEPSAIVELLESLPQLEGVSGEAEVLADETVVGDDVEGVEGNDGVAEMVERDVEGVELEGNDAEAEAETSREAKQLRDVEGGIPVVEAGEGADVVVEEEGKEEMEEEVLDEDGWEGIERSELEKDFAAAARFAGDRKDRLEAVLGDESKMQLYGLHKVATEGPCRDSPPMAVKVAARAKWYPCFFLELCVVSVM